MSATIVMAPLDGSPAAEAALPWAIHLARRQEPGRRRGDAGRAADPLLPGRLAEADEAGRAAGGEVGHGFLGGAVGGDGGSLIHYNGAAQVIPLPEGGCRFTWTSDLLPNDAAPTVQAMIEAGIATIKRAQEAAE